MPKVSRTRVVSADLERVWDLVSDPHSLPRWWPRTLRVEDVHDDAGSIFWTSVLETDRGTNVRADYRRVVATPRERYGWEQEIAGTPFERILRASTLEIALAPADGSTRVTLSATESLRGLSRLGSPMLTGAAKRRLDDALAGIERALVGAVDE